MNYEWEEQFAEENNRIREKMAASSFEDIRNAFCELEEKLSATVDEPTQREVRRRAAKWLLYAAIDMKIPFEECQSLLGSVESLGFASPQERVITVAVFARYCLLSGHKADGYRWFSQAMTDLEKAPSVMASAPPELVEGYRRLLDQLASL